jgi:hypothetical protein
MNRSYDGYQLLGADVVPRKISMDGGCSYDVPRGRQIYLRLIAAAVGSSVQLILKASNW